MATSMRVVMSLAGFLLTAGLLTACSDETEGDPTSPAMPSSSGTEPPVVGEPDIPKVANPLNVDRFLDNPCQLVQKDVVAAVGDMKPGEPDTDSDMAKNLTGPGCKWYSKGSGASLSLVFETVHRDNGTGGIKGVYNGKESGLIEDFEPTEVAGYPAAVVPISSDDPADTCPLSVGISDDLLFVARVTDHGDPDDACAASRKVAESVIETLKGS